MNNKTMKLGICGNDTFPFEFVEKKYGITVKNPTNAKDISGEKYYQKEHERIVLDAVLDNINQTVPVEFYYLDFTKTREYKKALLELDIDMINISWTGTGLNEEFVAENINNLIVITAAGNKGSIGESHGGEDPNVITIGAIEKENGKYVLESYSGHGKNYVDFVDIGDEKYSYDGFPNGERTSTGTSFSTPKFFAKAVKAVYEFKKTFNRKMTSLELINFAAMHSIDLGEENKDTKFGWGYYEPPTEYDFSILGPIEVEKVEYVLKPNEDVKIKDGFVYINHRFTGRLLAKFKEELVKVIDRKHEKEYRLKSNEGVRVITGKLVIFDKDTKKVVDTFDTDVDILPYIEVNYDIVYELRANETYQSDKRGIVTLVINTISQSIVKQFIGKKVQFVDKEKPKKYKLKKETHTAKIENGKIIINDGDEIIDTLDYDTEILEYEKVKDPEGPKDPKDPKDPDKKYTLKKMFLEFKDGQKSEIDLNQVSEMTII